MRSTSKITKVAMFNAFCVSVPKFSASGFWFLVTGLREVGNQKPETRNCKYFRKFNLVWYTLFFLIFFSTCINKKNKKDFFEHKGFAVGTTFIIEYDKNAGNLNNEIDKIFSEIELSILLTDSSSLLSRINRNDSVGTPDQHFIKLLSLSKRIHQETKGFFDPTISTLTTFWGFNEDKFKNQQKAGSLLIDSLRRDIGLDKVYLLGNTVIKKNRHLILDFGDIYKGYVVDLIVELFNNYNVTNYRIEIGEKMSAKGLNSKEKKWQLGIDAPTDPQSSQGQKTRKLLAIATLDNEGYAIAGSYRKYFTKNGIKFPFTIDPITGYPVKHTLISVSVFAPSCAEAEAYSTAFMVMGVENTKIFLNTHPQLQVYMISTNYKGEWLTFISNGLKEKLEFVKEESASVM